MLMKAIFFVKKQIQLKTALKFVLSDDTQLGETVFIIKEDTVEQSSFQKVANHIVSGKISFTLPAIYMKKYTDALIFPSSDFIIIQDKAVWHKSKYPHFTKIMPLDKNLIKYRDRVLYIQMPKKIIEIKNGFSLCGVHSKVWAHFIVQYLPKIDYIQRIIDTTSDTLTIIIPQYKDPQIKEIINTFLKNIEGLTIIELKDDEAAKCKCLYYVENTSVLSDHASYICPSDLIIPKFVLSFLKDKFICNQNLFPSIKNRKTTPYRKLFINRGVSALSPLGDTKNMKNISEIEQYFKEEGFEFISPHEYSIDAKRNLFHEALYIVGPASSGFINMIFSQPDTKVLMFINFQRVYDLYGSILADNFDIDLHALTGNDTHPSDIHSSYSISLEKVISAYKNLVD